MNLKSLVCKLLSAIVLIAVSTGYGYSQTRSVEHDFSPFDGIDASNGFKVSITTGDRYSAKLTIDDALESYVHCYVKAGVLYIGLDDKGIPKELKKMYRGKNSPEPTLVAVVSMPLLKSLTLNDDSRFFSSGKLVASELVINMAGSSVANNLDIVGKTLSLNVSKSARFTNASVSAEGDVDVISDGKAAIAMECKAGNLAVNAQGSSTVDVNGEFDEKIKVDASSSSMVSLSGKAESLDVSGKGTTSKIDASALDIENAIVAATGVSVDLKPSKNLELDLGRGAEVTYAGNPAVNIVKIQSASVLRK